CDGAEVPVEPLRTRVDPPGAPATASPTGEVRCAHEMTDYDTRMVLGKMVESRTRTQCGSDRTLETR
ncbi:hypothetical protein PIB30_115968, partial [Stylosanthes scabra]|nr:hypothetical protein [Stylosanthes scabra]